MHTLYLFQKKNSEFENSEFENFEFENSEFENLELKIESERAFIPTGIRFENFFGTYLCQQSTLVLEVQP